MSYKFNPFIGNLDEVGGGSTLYLPTVQSESDLPVGDPDGAVRIVRDTDRVYVYDLTGATWTDSGISLANFAASANTKGISIAIVADGILTNILRPTITLHPADASNPGAVSISNQEFSGNKDFQNDVLVQGQTKTNTLDTLSSGDTLGIGIANANIINIGNSSATVNIIGTVNNNNVTNLNVTDKLVTINDGGGTGSGSDSGIEIEENNVITGYVKTSADRNSMRIKAPNASGEVFIAPNNNNFSQVYNSATLTSNRIITTPDISGTMVLTEGNQTINGNKTLSGDTNLQGTTTLSGLTGPGPLKIDGSNEIITDLIDLTTEVNNILPLGSGGTNSSALLNGDRVMISAGGAIVENAPIASNRALVSSLNGLPTESVTTDTELSYVNGVTSSIQTQLNAKEPTITVLPISKGGTNSSTALNNNRIIESNGGAIVERAALTNGQLIIGSTGANPVNATLTAGSGINISNDAGSVTISNSTFISGDISETQAGLLNNQVSPLDLPGLAFSNVLVRSFEAQVSIYINATTDLHEVYKLVGVQRGSDWSLSQQSTGDDSLISFSITNSGQIQYISGNYSGFIGATARFRAQVTGV